MTIGKTNLERLRIGRALADRLPQHKSPSEVAKLIGVSKERLRQIEGMALYKVAQRLREITNYE